MIYLKTATQTYTLLEKTTGSQDLNYLVYTTPFSDVSNSIYLGLRPREVSIFSKASSISIPFDQVLEVSFDNITWQKVLSINISFDYPFAGFKYKLQIKILLSPLRSGTVHSSGDKWGLASTTLANAGDHTAYAKLVYYAPRYCFPLLQNLVDFAGSSIDFTNASSKIYKGISYPANTPIFNLGLYLSNEFVDVAKMTFYNSTVHTIIAQIKSTRYPSDWVVGGSGGNLLTANQSNIETDLTGLGGGGGTFTRTTTAGEFYAGIAGAKLVSTGSNNILIYLTTKPAVTAGKYYCASAYVKSSTITKNWSIQIEFYNASDVLQGTVVSTQVVASTLWTRLFVIGKAPATTTKAVITMVMWSAVVNDVLYEDNLMLEQINETSVTVWNDGSKNKLYIDIPNNLLKWTDYTSTISCAFPTDQFLQENSGYIRKIITIVAIHNGATKEIHCKYDGGAFADGTGALNALVWTNIMTLGEFDGSLFNLIQYNYILSSANYSALNFTLNSLKWNGFYVANITAGTITFEEGKLTDENGNEISGLVSGDYVTDGTIEMVEGLSAKWTAEIKDTYFP